MGALAITQDPISNARASGERPRPRSARRLNHASSLGLCVCLMLAGSTPGCERRKTPLEEMNLSPEDAKRILGEISAKAQPEQTPLRSSRRERPDLGDAGSAAEVPIETQSIEPALAVGPWVVDGLVDVGDAAPSTASERGVVLIDGENQLYVAELGRLAAGTQPSETPITPLREGGRFALGRGPTLADGYAYWVTSHFLLRRPLRPPYAPLEILAQDARVGTRTSALAGSQRSGRPPWVAYVALPEVKDGPLRTKLWYGQEHSAVVNEAGTSTLSVELVEHDDQIFVLSLEARFGLSNIHARPIAPGPIPKPGTDRVVWVGGGANPLSELRLGPLRGAQDPRGLLLLLPLERDISSFGLALLSLPDLVSQRTPDVHWLAYANGINPAPVDGAVVCGRPVVSFTRPSAAEAGSPQELVLMEVARGRPQTELVLARSRAFYDVSLAGLKNAALISYVADHRTWARTVRCVAR